MNELWILSTVELILLSIVIQRSSNHHVQLYQKVAILFVWFWVFFPFIMIPIEVIYNQKNISEDSEEFNTLYVLWWVFYILIMVNGFITLPLLSHYNISGEFTFKNKLKDSVVTLTNKYKWITIISVLAVAMIYIFASDKTTNIFSYWISVYNTL